MINRYFYHHMTAVFCYGALRPMGLLYEWKALWACYPFVLFILFIYIAKESLYMEMKSFFLSLLQGSVSFLLGLFFIFVRWPILGILLEIYGCFVLFRLVGAFLLEFLNAYHTLTRHRLGVFKIEAHFWTCFWMLNCFKSVLNITGWIVI